MDLQEIRGKLDQIDRQFVELLEERLDLCGQVAADKIKTGKAVCLIRNGSSRSWHPSGLWRGNEFNARAAEELFTQLMTISRRLRYQIIEAHGKKIETGFTMVDSLKRSDQGGLSGVEGAYNHAAAMQYFGDDVDAYHVKHGKTPWMMWRAEKQIMR